MRTCESCGNEIVRRHHEGRNKWARRRFCSVPCSWGSPTDPDLEAKVAEAYRDGMKIDDIKAAYNIGARRIFHIVERAGVPKRRGGPAPAPLPPAEEVAATIRRGTPFSRLGKDLHKSDDAVRRHLVDAGYNHLTGLPLVAPAKPRYKTSDTGPMHYVGGRGHWGGLPMREAS